jgi:cell division protease FtsH
MEKKTQFNVWYLILAIVGVMLIRDLWVQSRQVEPIAYSKFEQYLDQGLIEKVVVGSQQISGTFKSPLPEGQTRFITTRVESGVAERLEKAGVEFSGAVESTFLRDLLSWIVPVVFFFGLWLFVFRKLAEKQGFGGMMTIGKSKAKIYVEKDTKTTFERPSKMSPALTKPRKSFRKSSNSSRIPGSTVA